ncbi:MAG: flagellar protein FlgN [Deltaproteobacteria bacterium]|nr:flagellar protein FlgN [Deltaproteobacteria bacterium]
MDITVVQNLAEQLDAHLARYQELIDYLDREKKCLLSLDLDGLLTASQAKEQLARNIHDNLPPFTASLTAAALMLGLTADPPPTLSEAARLCPEPYGNRLNEGAMTLARLKNVILRENEANRQFVEHSLELVNDSINVLTGASQIRGEGYRKDGSKDKSVKKALPRKLSKEV